MPPLISNGPDIPERLLQLHEDEDVVFFCGAGISRPAGLPLFGDLIQEIYETHHLTKDFVGWATLQKEKRYDSAVGLLENKIAGGKEVVRETLHRILSNWDPMEDESLATHKAILTLGKDKKRNTRLVTTNFDRIFEHLIELDGLDVDRDQAPTLAVPKRKWSGLTYLHGLLPEEPNSRALNKLVLSSGDFGLAYLAEGWATRFVIELLRNYTVCFVGYSIDDPILRYIMDAIAADRAEGQSWNKPYAFGAFKEGDKETEFEKWKAKNVYPIMYDEGDGCHMLLHETIRQWANIYRVGTEGKAFVVNENAGSVPLTNSRNDPAVGKVLWALSEPEVAQRFADKDPVPPIEWLGAIFEKQYDSNDLNKFCLIGDASIDGSFKFSIGQRPTQLANRSQMSLVSQGANWVELDKVMFQLIRWLCRHLGDPNLIIWIGDSGGKLHPTFKKKIAEQLQFISNLENEDPGKELDKLLENAPNAIPNNALRELWGLVLSDRVVSGINLQNQNLIRVAESISKHGLSYALKSELITCLRPVIQLNSFRSGFNSDRKVDDRIGNMLSAQIRLTSDHADWLIKHHKKSEAWHRALPDLLDELDRLLRDALELNFILNDREVDYDNSHHYQPSISPHSQNQSFRDWVVLIELTRDSWEKTTECDQEKALRFVEAWWASPYPLHQRMALHAGTFYKVIPSQLTVSHLLANGAELLWSLSAKREVCRFLVEVGSKIGPDDLLSLERVIIDGPDEGRFKYPGEDTETWVRTVNQYVWLRLGKLDKSGADLSPNTIQLLEELRTKYPNWAFEENQREEFSGWVGAGLKERTSVVPDPPQGFKDLVIWLCENDIPEDPFNTDGWYDRCQKDVKVPAAALKWLAMHGKWLKGRWNNSLYSWGDDKYLQSSWNALAKFFLTISSEEIYTIVPAYASWLDRVTRKIDVDEETLLKLINPVLSCPFIPSNSNRKDPIGLAINHPIGDVTQAILHHWYRLERTEGDGLKEPIQGVLTDMCTNKAEGFQHARTILASNVVALHWANSEWTRMYIVPLFDWGNPEQASAAWEGFLWSPKLYRPFIEDIRESLLETVSHTEELGDHAKQYARFITYAALDPGETFKVNELSSAFEALPISMLEESAIALFEGQESAEEEREEYWEHRVKPFLEKVWPQSNHFVSARISEFFAKLAIISGKRFPEAVSLLKRYLIGLKYDGLMANDLTEEQHGKFFPDDTLELLSLIYTEQTAYYPKSLVGILNEIGAANPALKVDPRYLRILELLENGPTY